MTFSTLTYAVSYVVTPHSIQSNAPGSPYFQVVGGKVLSASEECLFVHFREGEWAN